MEPNHKKSNPAKDVDFSYWVHENKGNFTVYKNTLAIHICNSKEKADAFISKSTSILHLI